MNPVDPTQPVPVAIIGMGCLFPRADDLAQFWANIRHRRDAITEVPPSHWRPEDYYDPDPKTPDHTYAKRGGFLNPVDFPPLEFGIAPNNLEATDTTQLLGLLVAREALEDAGYGEGSKRPLDRSRVSVILGVTGTLELVIPLGARLGHPIWRRALKASGVPETQAEEVVKRIADSYVGWQENSFPGLLGNVAAGRIANRLDLGGTNCVIDAACASSLGALSLATLELASGRCDVALSGGLDTFNDIFMYMCFSKTPALSPSGDARPFDAGCDGTILGEGLGVVALKRLEDARRDGDKIYAVIRSVGASSDGKGSAVYAPKPSGQARALEQAYRLAGIGPETIELVEAHGTGTKVGDASELSALNSVYSAAQPDKTWCALGSVKSQIGHTKAAAGVAGLIKAALALHHKVLPPTIKVDTPIDGVGPGRSPFYVNTEARPWLPRAGHPRRAAVSAFGFGGSNFHCVLEEAEPAKTAIDWDGETQILAFSASSAAGLLRSLDAFPRALDWPRLREAAALARTAFKTEDPHRLVVVVERESDLSALLVKCREAVDAKGSPSKPRPGIFAGNGPAAAGLAMLFPGQGSQYAGMLRELACVFPQVQEALARADDDASSRLSDRIYPFPAFNDAERAAHETALRATEVAQPAIGALSLGLLRVLDHFGVRPSAVAGHSFGELTALCAAGRIDEASFVSLARERGRLMAAEGGGAMLAVMTTRGVVDEVLRAEGIEVVVANANAPRQFVLSGSVEAIERAANAFASRKVSARALAVSSAFHSRAVAGASEPFLNALRNVEIAQGSLPVYANTTAAAYPADADAARVLLAGQIARPVEFMAEIEAMAEAGIGVFLEVGPDAKLSGLVRSILEGRPVRAIAVDASRGARGNLTDLASALAELAALGYPVALSRWDPLQESDPETSTRKPGMTVKVSGANHTPRRLASDPTPTPTPTPPRIPQATAPMTSTPPPRASAPEPTPSQSRNGRTADHHPAPSSNGHSHGTGNGNGTYLPAAPLVPIGSSDPGLIAQALRSAQESLVALQKLSEQTASLHRQFLDGQDKAQRTFQSLLDQQQRLTLGSLGLAPVPQQAAAPAVHPRVVEPAAIRPRFVEPAAAVSEPQPARPPAPAPAKPTATDRVEAVLVAVVAEKTGYPAEMLDLDMQLDADLGIDSIKRVEILSDLQERLPDAPAIKPEHLGTLRTLREIALFLSAGEAIAPVSKTAPNLGAVESVLVAVVAEKTGYPAEMLEPSMELDADLGIDSIKRVEILSDLQERLPDAPAIKPEHLGTLRTLREIALFLSAGSAAPGSSPVAEVLIAVVAEKTGYPAEMLDLDMQLDADLGIVWMKRFVIISDLQERLPDAPAIKPEHLGTLRTLREIAQFLAGSGEVAAVAPAAAPAPSVVEAPGTVQRLVVRSATIADDAHATSPLRGGAEIVVTDDGTGLSSIVVEQLARQGYRARLAGWSEAGSVKSIDGLVLVAPASPSDGDELIGQAFRWLRSAGAGLRRASGLAVTVSRLGGCFGVAGLDERSDPSCGGLAGVIKTAGHEWPEVRCKAIDLDPAFGVSEEAAAAVVAELFRGGPAEVGLSTAGRATLTLSAEVVGTSSLVAPIEPGDVVVVTGGARGVTAEVAVALAESLRPTLVLFGRSPAPQNEPDWLSPLAGEVEIKRALTARANGQATPQLIGERFRTVSANREILRNLDRIEAAGSRALYRQVDVRDPSAVASAIAEVTAELGPVRGLIHGAGVLADRRIEDQTDAQFDDVYATKVAGWNALLGAIGPDDLRALVVFSSSTARFGRNGQVAYAAANEALNKHARREAAQRPGCRVVALNWGPWDGGMVTPSLRPLFAAEGVGLIPLGDGARFLVDEVRAAPEGQPIEVVVLGPGSIAMASPAPMAVAPVAKEKRVETALTTVFERPLDPDAIPVLRSHVIDGRAVMPLALMLEWLAQGAIQRNPGLAFCGVDDLRLFKGAVAVDDATETIAVLVGKASKEPGGVFRVPVELRGHFPGGKTVTHARGEVVLGDHPPSAGPRTIETAGLPAYGRSPRSVYHDVLFHGPDLHGLERIEACTLEAVSATVRTAPAPTIWIERPLRQAWLTDPLVLDSAFQLLVLWAAEHAGAPALPTVVGRYRQYCRTFPSPRVQVVARVRRPSALHAVADFEFLDASGVVLARLDGYECVGNPSLNQAFRRNRLPKVARSPG